MTARKALKRLIRARMKQTGESYTAARQFFLDAKENINMSMKTICNPDFGLSLHVPESWEEREPDLNNGPFEIMRFVRSDGDRFACSVFRPQGNDPRALAEANQADLATKGFNDFALADITLSNREAVKLDFQKPTDGTARRHYFIPLKGQLFVLTLATRQIEEDARLFDQIAASLDVIADPVSIVLRKEDDTPASFVVDTLEGLFGYSHSKALRTAVRIDSQCEGVVALVAKQDAAALVDQVTQRATTEGVSLQCRIA